MTRRRSSTLSIGFLLQCHLISTVFSFQHCPLLLQKSACPNSYYCFRASNNVEFVPAQYEIVDRESHWVYMFYLLMVYKEREGHCRVPTSHVEAEWKLGIWLAKQREAYKMGTIHPTYQGRLQEVGVVWDPCTWQWEARLGALKEFKRREGHCDVPQFHQENGECLGTWLNTQRRDYRLGKLSAEREDALKELGVAWNVFGKRWDEMFDFLVQFKEREGHCIVPVDHKEGGKNLGAWVSTQRKARRSKTLDVGREEMLDSIGMIWSVQEVQWESMFALTKEYMKREQTTDIPLKQVEKGRNLGHWISKQKQLNRGDKLEPERRRRLMEVGVL